MTEEQKAINLSLQRRLAADILGCGKYKVQFVEGKEQLVSGSKSRAAIRSLIKSKLIFRRQDDCVSRGRFRVRAAAKRLGRHTGEGKRKGTRNARAPTKDMWIHRMRSERKLLRKYRDEKKITPTEYHSLYYKVKGNQYRNKRILLEQIINIREEAKRQAALQSRAEDAKDAAVARNAQARIAKDKVAGK